MRRVFFKTSPFPPHIHPKKTPKVSVTTNQTRQELLVCMFKYHLIASDTSIYIQRCSFPGFACQMKAASPRRQDSEGGGAKKSEIDL